MCLPIVVNGTKINFSSYVSLKSCEKWLFFAESKLKLSQEICVENIVSYASRLRNIESNLKSLMYCWIQVDIMYIA